MEGDKDMTYTQIYSLQFPDEALACIEAGADRLGCSASVAIMEEYSR